ncbi:MAG: hypothetical protein AAF337_10390 [Pseudomonadota bacterium]
MRNQLFAIIGITTVSMASPALSAELHNCGNPPALPAMFDVESAGVDDIKLTASEYKAYQDENTAYIDCLKSAASSDEIQGMKKKKRKKAMATLDDALDETVANENRFADAFNDNFTMWKEKRQAATQ